MIINTCIKNAKVNAIVTFMMNERRYVDEKYDKMKNNRGKNP